MMHGMNAAAMVERLWDLLLSQPNLLAAHLSHYAMLMRDETELAVAELRYRSLMLVMLLGWLALCGFAGCGLAVVGHNTSRRPRARMGVVDRSMRPSGRCCLQFGGVTAQTKNATVARVASANLHRCCLAEKQCPLTPAPARSPSWQTHVRPSHTIGHRKIWVTHHPIPI